MPDSTNAADFTFDGCTVRRESRQVVIDGQPARLGARAFDLLLILIEQRDRVVSKNELINLVWPGLVIEENNLQVHISALRKLLGPQAIATIPGRGYRFTASLAPLVCGAIEAPGINSGKALATTAAAHDAMARETESPILIGRDDDVIALASLLTAHRLVTLVGAGGIGKTVLAQAIGRVTESRFEYGVCIVDLAPTTDASQLAAVVAGAVRLTLGTGEPARALADALAIRQMMIVLDNCEHLIDAVASLATLLLQRAPALQLLATSQAPLKIHAEQVYRLGTLVVPTRVTGVTLDEAKETSAVCLFVHRAIAADHRFVLDEANVAAVADICSRLDGIPLAIELAAARVQLMGAQGLRERLGQRLHVLGGGTRTAPPRHRTLRAALEWSHALFTPEQQAVFRRLGVMSGTFGLAASQQVAALGAIDTWSVLDHLGALVDKSLITAMPSNDGEVRYRMLETMRQFALERLTESGEQQTTRERHLVFFLALATDAKKQLEGPEQGVWLRRLDHDRDNLLSAHVWCNQAEDGAVRGLRLVNALPRFWLSRGLLTQGHDAVIEALARPCAATADTREYDQLRCEGLLHAGRLCGYRGLDRDSRMLLEESVSISRKHGFTELLASALAPLGFVLLTMQDPVGARVYVEEALDLARQLENNPALISLAATNLAELERVEGNFTSASNLFEEALRHVRVTADRLRTMIALNNLAMVAVVNGDSLLAREMLLESLGISDELDSRRGRLVVMEVCAGLASHLAQWALVARFDGAADMHTVQMGRRRDVGDAAFLAPLIVRARMALGATDYAAALAAGRALSYDDAVDFMVRWLNLETSVDRSHLLGKPRGY